MSDQEIVDLFAGLKAGPAHATPSKPHEVMFPFNIRLAMAGWKNLFFHPRRFEPDPDKVGGMEPRRLPRQRPRPLRHLSLAAQPLRRDRDGQGVHRQPVDGGPGGKTPNITAHDLIRKEYTEAALIDALTTGFAPDFDVLTGPMGEEIEDSTKHWTPEDLRRAGGVSAGRGQRRLGNVQAPRGDAPQPTGELDHRRRRGGLRGSGRELHAAARRWLALQGPSPAGLQRS